MQVETWTRNFHLVRGATAQRCDNGRAIILPHACIANQHHVSFQQVLVGCHKAVNVGGVAFLVAFNHNRQTKRQFTVNRKPLPCGFGKSHELALVVGHATGKDARLAGCCFAPARLKRRAVPEVQGNSRLYVVVTIEQDVRDLAFCMCNWNVFRNHHRLARGGVGPSRKAHAFEIVHHPLSCFKTVCIIGRVSGNGGKAQHFAQAGNTVFNIRVNGGKYGGYVVGQACESLNLAHSLIQVAMIGQSA